MVEAQQEPAAAAELHYVREAAAGQGQNRRQRRSKGGPRTIRVQGRAKLLNGPNGLRVIRLDPKAKRKKRSK